MKKTRLWLFVLAVGLVTLLSAWVVHAEVTGKSLILVGQHGNSIITVGPER